MTKTGESSFENQALVAREHDMPSSIQKELLWDELEWYRGAHDAHLVWPDPPGKHMGEGVVEVRTGFAHARRHHPVEYHDLPHSWFGGVRQSGPVSSRFLEKPIEIEGRWLQSIERADVLYYAKSNFVVWEDPVQKEREKNLRKLSQSETQEDILMTLESAGFSKEVEQLRQYLEDRATRLEEGEHPGIRLESLRAVSRFLISHYDLPFSAIRSDFDGYADMEWYLSSEHEDGDEDDLFWVDGGGQIVLKFVTPNLIEFAMLSGPWLDCAERLSLTGTMSHSKMKVIIEMFIGRMVAYGEG